jgi:FecR protein
MKGLNRVGLALLATAALGFAQMTGTQAPARDAGTRSVAPGTINYIEGQVSLDAQPLGANTSVPLQPGQTLATGPSGFAEVLLTPGAFVRIGHNSQLRFRTAGLADTQAELDRGSAIVEADQLINGTNLSVVMNNATAQIEKKGLYDFDAGQQAVKVLDGKVRVTEPAGTKTIGKDDELLLASATPLKKTGFDKNTVKSEPLYVWSEARSQDESQANVALAQNVAAYGGWYGPGWYWDPYWSFYAYLPGSGFLYSPFGWGFYSPAYIGYWGVPFGYYGHYGRYGYLGHGGVYHGRVGGVAAAHVGGFRGGFAGGGHAFAGGGFHGGGHR